MPNDIYLSFFMFTTDMRPTDRAYTEVVVRHMKELLAIGYAGFDLPIHHNPVLDHGDEVASYVELKRALDAAGLDGVPLSINVGATRMFDPTSPYEQQRDVALAYLKSRVDIAAALGGKLMAGPIVFPYNLFPVTDYGEPVWSDALQDWAARGYRDVQPVLVELGDYASDRDVNVAIEPVAHWETPAPNLVGEVMALVEGVPSRKVGVCVDIAQVVLGSEGVAEFTAATRRAVADSRLHSVHISAPDRGAVHDSWIPWPRLLDAIRPGYDGPLLVEIFNAIPAFLDSLRLTRRKFWIPGEDPPRTDVPDAYTVAGEALAEVRAAIGEP